MKRQAVDSYLSRRPPPDLFSLRTFESRNDKIHNSGKRWSTRESPLSTYLGIAAAIDCRTANGLVLNVEEALSVGEALTAYTEGGPFARGTNSAAGALQSIGLLASARSIATFWCCHPRRSSRRWLG